MDSNIAPYHSEEWKFVEDFDNYKISTHGRLYSVKRNSFKSPSISRDGYCVASLFDNGKSKMFSIHRLVAIAFIPNPDNLPQVNHVDEVKENNLVSNLEWCTAFYNTEYSQAKYYEVMTPDGTIVEIFNLSKFCRENNLHKGHMSAVALGKESHYKGYKIWELPNAEIPTGSL